MPENQLKFNLNSNFLLQRTATTRSFQNGISTETRIMQTDGQEIIEHYENGVLKSRIVNGTLQALPTTSQNNSHSHSHSHGA